MEVFGQQCLEHWQILSAFSKETFAGLLELGKRFIIVIVQHLLFEELPVPLNRSEIVRVRRQEDQFDFRPLEPLLQPSRPIGPCMVHDDINHLGPGVPGFQASEQIHRRLGVNRLVKPHRRLQRLDVESRPASAQPRYTHPEADPGCRLGGTGRNSGGRSSRPAGGFRRSGPLTPPLARAITALIRSACRRSRKER